ncbi:hypothetical protein TRVL_08377 [Trypanosoma vivax]|nr:hypothetical protein TRVL_08377 [Trypanosoma vivax]
MLAASASHNSLQEPPYVPQDELASQTPGALHQLPHTSLLASTPHELLSHNPHKHAASAANTNLATQQHTISLAAGSKRCVVRWHSNGQLTRCACTHIHSHLL